MLRAARCLQAQGQAQNLKQQNAKLHDQAHHAQQQLEAAQRQVADLQHQVCQAWCLFHCQAFESGPLGGNRPPRPSAGLVCWPHQLVEGFGV